MSQLSNIHKNILGTPSFDLKIKGMRKEQEFDMMPISADDDSNNVVIQSETRIGKLNLKTGKGQMSKSHQSGAYFHHLSFDKKTEFELSQESLEELKSFVAGTASANAGDSFVKCDNSGAARII